MQSRVPADRRLLEIPLATESNRPCDGTKADQLGMEWYPPFKEVTPMPDSPRLTFRPATFTSAFGRAIGGALGAAIATAVALAAFVVITILSWDAVAGLQGVGLCGALGAAAGVALSGPGSRLARVLGGGIGGIVAGYFALASGEMFPPATMQWALGGAAVAASFALPVAILVGGIIGGTRSRAEDDGR
jgi:hypothetical protein